MRRGRKPNTNSAHYIDPEDLKRSVLESRA